MPLTHTENTRQTRDADVSLCFGISVWTELFPSESTFDRSGFGAVGSVITEGLTNDAKDAQDVGSEDDQYIDEGQEDSSDGDVSDPVEGLIREYHLLNGSSHLSEKVADWSLRIFSCYFWATLRSYCTESLICPLKHEQHQSFYITETVFQPKWLIYYICGS